MTCPDCGGELKGVPLGNAGDVSESLRCYQCGGFLLSTWLANRVNSRMLANFDAHTGATALQGTNVCPRDNTPLRRFIGESVPQNLEVRRCEKCSWWWFPGNNLFAFKPAQEAKVAYFKSWGMAASLSALLLPIMTLVLIVAGTTVGVNLLRYRQKAGISASSEASAVFVGYLGNGQALVSFRAPMPVTQVTYHPVDSDQLSVVEVHLENGLYIGKIENLVEGTIYQVTILGKDYELRAI